MCVLTRSIYICMRLYLHMYKHRILKVESRAGRGQEGVAEAFFSRLINIIFYINREYMNYIMGRLN